MGDVRRNRSLRRGTGARRDPGVERARAERDTVLDALATIDEDDLRSRAETEGVGAWELTVLAHLDRSA